MLEYSAYVSKRSFAWAAVTGTEERMGGKPTDKACPEREGRTVVVSNAEIGAGLDAC